MHKLHHIGKITKIYEYSYVVYIYTVNSKINGTPKGVYLHVLIYGYVIMGK